MTNNIFGSRNVPESTMFHLKVKIMEKKELMKAPIDGKNVTTDWIEEVFDYQSAVRNKSTMVGFIHERPVIATWSDNILIWQFPLEQSIEDSNHLAVLKDRLSAYHDPDSSLTETFKVFGKSLMQQFYWKNEE